MTKSNQTLVGAGKAAANQSRGSEAMVFSNPEFGTVRIQVDGNGEPWFCGKDVCEVLGYRRAYDTVSKRVNPHDTAKRSISTPVISQGQDTGKTKLTQMLFVNESGFYALVLGSKLDTAQKFRHWVTSVVLPQIRKTGGYIPVRECDTGEDICRRAEEVLRATLEQKNKLIREQEALLDGKCRIIAEQEKEIDRLLPKALYADTVLDSVSCFTTSQIAKELGMTAQELNRLLCARHIQYYQSGQYMLYAEYAHMGLAKSRTHYDLFVGADTIHTRMYLVWTERGRRFIHDNVQCIMNNL